MVSLVILPQWPGSATHHTWYCVLLRSATHNNLFIPRTRLHLNEHVVALRVCNSLLAWWTFQNTSALPTFSKKLKTVTCHKCDIFLCLLCQIVSRRSVVSCFILQCISSQHNSWVLPVWQCVMYVVDCLLRHSPPLLITAAKCLLIGRHTDLYGRAIDILKQADDVICLPFVLIVYLAC